MHIYVLLSYLCFQHYVEAQLFGSTFKYEDVFKASPVETTTDIIFGWQAIDSFIEPKINEINIDEIASRKPISYRSKMPKSNIPVFVADKADYIVDVKSGVEFEDSDSKSKLNEDMRESGIIKKRNAQKQFVRTRKNKRVRVRIPLNRNRQGRLKGYLAPPISPDTSYGSPPADLPSYAPSSVTNTGKGIGPKPTRKPIAILKMTGLDDALGPIPKFNYMYKTANNINAMAEGELRNICDEDVTVMEGSYDYKGPDGRTYKVDWYADETGFHPTGEHFPKPVKPNHPEVAAAVKAQIAFARQQDAKNGGATTGNPCPPKVPVSTSGAGGRPRPNTNTKSATNSDTSYGAPPLEPDLTSFAISPPELDLTSYGAPPPEQALPSYAADLPSYQ